MKIDLEEDYDLDGEYFAEGETSKPPSMDLVEMGETSSKI